MVMVYRVVVVIVVCNVCVIGMTSVRESVEWLFGEVSSKFPFLDCTKMKKLRGSPVEATCFTCYLLYNLYVTCQGSQSMAYFAGADNEPVVDMFVPTMEDFMA
jgi:hypothetical protein